jgi:uncharacterized surface protein with fasciclin (FAS1) repeats
MKTNKIKFLAVIAVIATIFTSCSSDSTSSDTTIAGLASSRSELSLLVQALDKAGLVATLQGAGPYTVFAPDNDAFIAFLADNGFATLDDVPLPLLTEVLKNHVVSGAVQSTGLTNNTYIKTLGKGSASSTNTLSMYVKIAGGTVTLNGGAEVVEANIIASNGVIHIVDEVIALPTVVTHALANPNFSSLVGALTGAGQPDFVSILSGVGKFTVFAPTNTAFTNLNTELAPGGIAGVSAANLTKVLQYHVVSPANVLAGELTNNQIVTPILDPAQTFTIELPTTGAQIKDASNRTSKIIITDVQCSNGVIHAVDKVLLPVL